MFTVTNEVERMLNQGYAEMLEYCTPCVLGVLRGHDEKLFAAETINDQVYNAKMGAQLIDACSNFNRDRTIEDEHVPPEKIDCCNLMEHYTKKGAYSDFRVRWEVMIEEMHDDFNRKATCRRFGLPENSDPNFIQLFLNYRLGKALYTFGTRHPDKFMSEEERARDHAMETKILKIVLGNVQEVPLTA